MRVLAALVLACASLPACAATFYVDALHGSDANAGTSPETAWQTLEKASKYKFAPGDALLLHAGQVFAGHLAVKGSGTAEHPITLGAYGAGAKPVIAGGGEAQALLLDDVSHWNVRGIAITNHGSSVGVRNGLEIHVAYARRAEALHFTDVDISDVNGDVHSKSAGGVGILGWAKNGHPVSFDDILFDHCSIRHADGQGLWVHMKGNANAPADEDDGRAPADVQYPITHLRITHTTIEDTGRNAVFVRDADGAVFDNNTVLHASARTHGNAVVIAWSKNTVVVANEVAFTGQGQGTGENGAFDADDGAVGTVFERNFTHDNTGGSVNVVVDPGKHVATDGTIIRYNVSEDDGARVFGLGGPVTNTAIVNNTIFLGRGVHSKVLSFGRFVEHKPGDPSGVLFANNIVYALGSAEYEMNASHVTVVSNCYFGKHAGGPKDAQKSTDDPGFDTAMLPARSWSELAALRPSAGSACAATSMRFAGTVRTDLLGTELPADTAVRGALAPRASK